MPEWKKVESPTTPKVFLSLPAILLTVSNPIQAEIPAPIHITVSPTLSGAIAPSV